jgi:hypothetical protein
MQETYGSVDAGVQVMRRVSSAAVSAGVLSLMPITDVSAEAKRMLQKLGSAAVPKNQNKIEQDSPGDAKHCDDDAEGETSSKET